MRGGGELRYPLHSKMILKNSIGNSDVRRHTIFSNVHTACVNIGKNFFSFGCNWDDLGLLDVFCALGSGKVGLRYLVYTCE